MSDSDDEPLIKKLPQVTNNNSNSIASLQNLMYVGRSTTKKAVNYAEQASDDNDDNMKQEEDSDDDKPLVSRKQVTKKQAPKPAPKRKAPAEAKQQSTKRSKGDSNGKGSIKWKTLQHAGVLFPPEYVPHGVKLLYEGKEVNLTPEQEEIATFYAAKLETPYVEKDIFRKNFFEDFKAALGKTVIKDLSKCDFSRIQAMLAEQKEAKKALTKEEKQKIKEEKEASELKYKTALVDNRKEQVGNFRVEPPSLFLGRGAHPKMGKVKRRIYPKDITINIGKGEQIPKHPYTGQKWKEVRHDNTVTWLAFWKDPINPKDFKYVWLAANSTFKTESDLAKYEKARKLKDEIGKIRSKYTKDWKSSDPRIAQMGVALYFIDKLALRAGHEKDEDEADTVGCCTLKVENIEILEDDQIKFDFLGKDSIRYENTVKVDHQVYACVKRFMIKDAQGSKKNPSSQLFDTFDATDLNNELKALMSGLSVKVFRTYNASVCLNDLLQASMEKVMKMEDINARKAEYDRANKEVAVLCNHQRSVPKTHQASMAKLQDKVTALKDEISELQKDLVIAKKGGVGKDGKKINPDSVQKKITQRLDRIKKLERDAAVREDLKTVALGTSKINYLDPRITVAWCKLAEVPMEKVFNKSLLSKFAWAMEVEPEYIF